MSLHAGGTRITGVYFGNPSVTYNTVNYRANTWGYSNTISYPTNVVGDMLLLALMQKVNTIPAPPDSSWVLYESLAPQDGWASALYYKFIPPGVQSLGTGLSGSTYWTVISFSGVNQTKPFGAYAEAAFTMTPTEPNSMTTPPITMTQTNGKALACILLQPKNDQTSWTTPAGYTRIFTDWAADQWAIYRNDRTTAQVAAATIEGNARISGFAHTIEILPSTSEAGLAQAVYLGTTKVWPDTFAGGGETLIKTPGDFGFLVPPGATAVDIVVIGGGGGGSGSAGGITPDGDGGGYGTWRSMTARVGVEITAGGMITGTVGAGGDAGTALFIAPGNGAATTVKVGAANLTSTGGQGGGAVEDRTGMTPPPYTFNGRTYAGGAGGNGSAVNGVPGQAPGGGGQGGRSDLLSSPGGAGGAGGVYFYVY